LLKFFAQDNERSLQTVKLHALKSGVCHISAWFTWAWISWSMWKLQKSGLCFVDV